MLKQLTVIVALCSIEVHARPNFVDRIPNGNAVAGFRAIGHTNGRGGGSLTPFGSDFAATQQTWTEALCRHDSDQDGATNGEELGDPCCEWSAGLGLAPSAHSPSHPGIPNTWTTEALEAMRCRKQAAIVDSSSTTEATTVAPVEELAPSPVMNEDSSDAAKKADKESTEKDSAMMKEEATTTAPESPTNESPTPTPTLTPTPSSGASSMAGWRAVVIEGAVLGLGLWMQQN